MIRDRRNSKIFGYLQKMQRAPDELCASLELCRPATGAMNATDLDAEYPSSPIRSNYKSVIGGDVFSMRAYLRAYCCAPAPVDWGRARVGRAGGFAWGTASSVTKTDPGSRTGEGDDMKPPPDMVE